MLLHQHLVLKVYGERKVKYCHKQQKKDSLVTIGLKCLGFFVGQNDEIQDETL